jgi:hypothetical protein
MVTKNKQDKKSREIITEPSRLFGKKMEGIGSTTVDGSGNLEITNTGGSSASEGGMGSGGGADKDKDAATTGTQGGEKDTNTWDPVKPKEEKVKES